MVGVDQALFASLLYRLARGLRGGMVVLLLVVVVKQLLSQQLLSHGQPSRCEGQAWIIPPVQGDLFLVFTKWLVTLAKSQWLMMLGCAMIIDGQCRSMMLNDEGRMVDVFVLTVFGFDSISDDPSSALPQQLQAMAAPS